MFNRVAQQISESSALICITWLSSGIHWLTCGALGRPAVSEWFMVLELLTGGQTDRCSDSQVF